MDDYLLNKQLQTALTKIKTILDVNRSPQYPAEVPHTYTDKFHLAEYLTTTAIVAHLNTLEYLGLTDKKLKDLLQWVKTRSVTLRLASEERCSYIEMKERVEVDPVTHVTEVSGLGSSLFSVKSTSKRTIKEYFWKFDVSYTLSAYPGNLVEEKVILLERKATCTVITLADSTPYPEVNILNPQEVNISWLLKYIKPDFKAWFTIDRLKSACKTPRRNPEIEAALSYFGQFKNWADAVHGYFIRLFAVQSNHGLDLSKINAENIFVPVVPLFEALIPESKEEEKSSGLVSLTPYNSTGPILSNHDINQFLAEEKRGILEKFSALASMFPKNDKIITVAEAQMLSILLHLMQITSNHNTGINAIEDMLYKQLHAAIGKHLNAVDFTNYMKFHNRKLFKPEYQPIPFCYAIRRPDHYPEGFVSLESQLDDGSIPEPLPTIVRSSEATRPMQFSLNAATKVAFMGERHLHAMVLHEFSGQSGQSLNLVSRARQFSSFILLVGNIISADLFEPKIATIIANKDDLKIPLIMEQIPTPKEFRDAIESLSPEQQRFAKAFRSMQLASTLFAVCIIQIKPQLEKLLRIPNDSLTKEIRLTQDLMELFIKYQIPSDLLSYDADPKASASSKIAAVKNYVSIMQGMIKQSESTQLSQQAAQFVYQSLDREQEVEAVRQTTKRKKQSNIKKDKEKSDKKSSHRSSNIASASKQPQLQIQQSIPQSQPQSQQPPQSQSQSQPQSQPQSQLQSQKEAHKAEETVETEDYTAIPDELDRKFEILDEDASLRPTIIQPGQQWLKSSQAALLSSPVTQTLDVSLQKIEKDKAFDLLDALTRSGCLTIDQASLHVIMASTHCFDRTLIDTVIQDNVNPIEKVERSSLIVATTIHNKPAIELVKPEQLDRVSLYSPILFPEIGPNSNVPSLTLPVEQKPLFQLKEIVETVPAKV